MFLEQNIASPAFLHPSFILQMQSTLHEEVEDHPHNHQEHHHSLLPCSNPQDFSRGIHAAKRAVSTFSAGNVESCEEDLSDDCSQLGGKKRRLNMEQVRTLEKSFELGNKLEPERKIQLARALGLRPRQIAIWFQNRRARWKTKQLEKDYGLLRRQFEAAKSENDALQLQNKKLQAEILGLRGMETPELINLNKETEGSCSNRSENSCEINLDISRTPGNQSISFFPSNRQLMMSSQILQSSSTPINDQHAVPEENFNSFLCGMEDQAAFWPWPDHHNRH